MNTAVEVLASGVAGGTSLLLAGLGETIGERAGVINLGTEGCMLVGALGAYAVAVETGSAWLGVLAGLLAGAALAAIFAGVVLLRRGNQLATGLAMTFGAIGLTAMLGSGYISQRAPRIGVWDIPLLRDIPWLGQILFEQDPLTYIALAAGPLAWLFLTRTRLGAAVRAAGERPDVLSSFAWSPTRLRAGAVIAGGALSGLAGAQLSVAYTGSWFEDMTQGRGFIAVALVIFAAWNPLRVVIGALLFGTILALSPVFQIHEIPVNVYLLDALPYVVTLAALAVVARRLRNTAPEALADVFG